MGAFIPIISAFLFGKRRAWWRQSGWPFLGRAFCLLPRIAAVHTGRLCHAVCPASSLIVIVIVGVTLSFIGRLPPGEYLAFPLTYLLTAIPLPIFILQPSQASTLWSSALGSDFTGHRESNHGLQRG